MQTKMIARHIAVSYVCPKCGFKFTLQGGVFDNSEFSDKILQKVKGTPRECSICKTALLKPKSITCGVEPMVNKNCYEIKWVCEECNTKWSSLHDIVPGTLNFSTKLANIKHTTFCINENCESEKVKTVSLIFNRKI